MSIKKVKAHFVLRPLLFLLTHDSLKTPPFKKWDKTEEISGTLDESIFRATHEPPYTIAKAMLSF